MILKMLRPKTAIDRDAPSRPRTRITSLTLPATIIGLSAFVPALFVEALRQFYFSIIHREGTY